MRLRSSARGVLQSLRSQQSNLGPAKVSRTSYTRYAVALTDPRGGDTTEEESEVESESEIEVASARPPEREPRAAAGKEGPRYRNMAHTAIAIHEDSQYDLSTDQAETEEMVQLESDRDESVDEAMHESSDESEDEVDETVVEDMRRLEESFTGISQKYRLINRIGEGTNALPIPSHCQLTFPRHFLYRIQSRATPPAG